MQKGGEGVQIACQIAYVIDGRPHTIYIYSNLSRNSSSVYYDAPHFFNAAYSMASHGEQLQEMQ